jgi:anti-sigma factor RsiW
VSDDILLLNAYIDGELDPAHALGIERRLAADPALAAERARIEALRGVVKRLPREAASPELRRRVAALVPAAPLADGRSAGRGLRWNAPWSANWGAIKWGAMAASVAIGLVAGSLGTYVAIGPGGQAPVAQLVVASHLRSLMASQAIDVASSDRHTVKPWFNGKLPQSPRVVDLAAQDFVLVGGRIDVIGLVPAPTLVYRRRLHLISLTALPVAASTAAAAAAPRRAIDGYNVVEWTDADHAYWAVSDLARPELEEFAAAFRAGEAEP